MAQTNFKASDMKKGKGDNGGKPGEREDNKILDAELAKLSGDPKAGNKVAQEYANGKKSSEQKLQDEISNTVEPDFEKSSEDVESPIVDDNSADEKAAAAVEKKDEADKAETKTDDKAEEVAEKAPTAKKAPAKKPAAKKTDDTSDSDK